jgi:hypothetical protein
MQAAVCSDPRWISACQAAGLCRCGKSRMTLRPQMRGRVSWWVRWAFAVGHSGAMML